MNQEQWTAVDRYFTDLFVPPDSALDAALEGSSAAGLPPIHVAPNQGKLLLLLAQVQQARNILEIGTLGGYSTIWLARSLPAGGRLITLEADPKHAEVARANIARAGLAEVVEVRLGSARDTLPQLAAESRGPFDLIFIDADKARYPEYFEWALKLSRRGSLIVADNVVRKGAVADVSSVDPNVQGVRRMNERVAAETRVSATAIQTVGSKGYDGFLIMRVHADPSAPAVGRPAGCTLKMEVAADGMRVTLRYFGHVTAVDMRAHLGDFSTLSPKISPGFSVLVDMSSLESMDNDCLPIMSRIMDTIDRLGVGRIVRVIPNHRVDIGLNILSRFHYRPEVPIHTCETLAEAIALLG